jgi:hypothetical protein
MALTLTEAEKFTTNMVKKGVLAEIIKDSIVMQKLPFIDVVGSAYQYLRENTLGSANFFDPGEVWTEETPTFTQKTAVIKIMGGDADVDEFLAATRSDKTDLTAETIQARAKGIKHSFLDKFYYGDNSANSKEFDGVHRLFSGVTAQQLHQGSSATGAALSAANLDLLLDTVRDGMPDVLLTTRAIRRRISAYVRANGGLYNADFNEFAQQATSWNKVRLEHDDFLVQTESISASAFSSKTGGATASVLALTFGSDALVGLQNGGLQVKKLGQLESKDAERWRIKWYVGLALMRTIRVGRLDGITDAAMTA